MARRLTWVAILVSAGMAVVWVYAQGEDTPAPGRLPNGGRLTPAGKLIQLAGDMPLRITAAPDGRSMLVLTGGYHDHVISVIDADKGVVRQELPMVKASAGLAVDRAQGAIYVSGGAGDAPNLPEAEPEIADIAAGIRAAARDPIIRLKWKDGRVVIDQPLKIPGLPEKDRFVLGLAVTAQRHLFVINAPTNVLYKLDLAKGRVLNQVTLGFRPAQLAFSPDESTVAVSNWGDQSVSMLDSVSLELRVRVPVGAHPLDLAFAPDGRLFVSNSGANTVSVIDKGRVTESIHTSLRPQDPIGSTPNALAISRDGHTLYVANADNNNLAVIDIHRPGESTVIGFIPTGWYPTTLGITPDGRQLVVGVGKGLGTRANWPPRSGKRSITRGSGSSTVQFERGMQMLTGYAEIIPVPSAAQLAAYTEQARANVPLGDRAITVQERRDASAAFRKIKHVIYIIKENKTYDAVLGDDPRGDGMKELALFGREYTPNAHALAEQGPLLDRYFLDGEVSVDGHYWGTSAYVTSFVERMTATFYGRRGSLFGDERVLESPAGFLWDAVRRAGRSYFSYGEFTEFPADRYPIIRSDSKLKGHSSTEWGDLPLGKDDITRARIFIRDLKAAEQTGDWPAFTVVGLPWDHTQGTTPGQPTIEAAVASNDVALGMIVDAVTHSRFWPSTAIFVTQDDPGGCPDHVDSRRSVALVLSPYVKVGLVDHTHYTMMSMVRTMEIILGLPPMTQHDRDATPMYRLFQAAPKLWTYTALPATVDLTAVNPSIGGQVEASRQLDFSEIDDSDSEALGKIFWEALRPGVPMPVPVRSAYSGVAWTARRSPSAQPRDRE